MKNMNSVSASLLGSLLTVAMLLNACGSKSGGGKVGLNKGDGAGTLYLDGSLKATRIQDGNSDNGVQCEKEKDRIRISYYADQEFPSGHSSIPSEMFGMTFDAKVLDSKRVDFSILADGYYQHNEDNTKAVPFDSQKHPNCRVVLSVDGTSLSGKFECDELREWDYPKGAGTRTLKVHGDFSCNVRSV